MWLPLSILSTGLKWEMFTQRHLPTVYVCLFHTDRIWGSNVIVRLYYKMLSSLRVYDFHVSFMIILFALFQWSVHHKGMHGVLFEFVL